jgi:tetrapyrrole methylase family protein / MazG family protein
MADQRSIDRLLDIVARLRGEGGCPWDRKQTLETLKPYLIEESYEVLDAIDSGDPGHHAEELGDVLLQVVLQSRIREEQGEFAFDDVAEHIAEKLVRRHPHVFGDVTVSGPDEVVRNWEAIKAEEKADGKGESRSSAVDGVPRHLPSLRRAHRIQSRAARVGFDWTEVDDVMAKVEEELAEIHEAMAGGDMAKVKEEIGDLLFAVVNLSRFQKIHAGDALDETISKFVRRFQYVEQAIRDEGRELTDCTLEEMDRHWDAAKEEERVEQPGNSQPRKTQV